MIKTLITVALVLVTLIAVYFYTTGQRRNERHIDALRVEANAICRSRGENSKGCQIMRDRVHARELQAGLR